MEKKRQAEPEALAEDAEASDESPGGGPSHEQELAATKIQSQVRGKQARRGVVETNFPNHWSRMRQAWSSPMPTPCRSFAVVLLCDVLAVPACKLSIRQLLSSSGARCS